MHIQGRLLLLVAFLFAACSHSERDAEESRRRERDQRFDTTLEQFTAKHGAERFDGREPGSLYRKLTLEVQDAVAATPSQTYLSISHQFDIYRDSSGLHLSFLGMHDHWVSLSCTDAQAADIRARRHPDRIGVQFAFAFTLSSAAPLHVELRGTSEGTGEDVLLGVTADDVNGRFLTGQLRDFVVLDEGESLE